MTMREQHRQRLLDTIHQWMRRHGVYFVLAFCFFFGTAQAATDETKKPVTKPSSLMKILSDKDFVAAVTAPAEKKKAAQTPAAGKSFTKVPVASKSQETSASDAKKKDEKTVEKAVKGTVTFIRKNKVAVEFAATAQGGEEILLAIGKDAQVKNVKTFSDIAQGDRVQVKYLETYREPKEKGGEPFVLSMVVQEIALLSKAKVGLTS
jgi:hypothetical protein